MHSSVLYSDTKAITCSSSSFTLIASSKVRPKDFIRISLHDKLENISIGFSPSLTPFRIYRSLHSICTSACGETTIDDSPQNQRFLLNRWPPLENITLRMENWPPEFLPALAARPVSLSIGIFASQRPKPWFFYLTQTEQSPGQPHSDAIFTSPFSECLSSFNSLRRSLG